MLTRRELLSTLPALVLAPALVKAATVKEPPGRLIWSTGWRKPSLPPQPHRDTELTIQLHVPEHTQAFTDLTCSVNFWQHERDSFAGVTCGLSGDALRNICQHNLDREDGTRWDLAFNQYYELNKFFVTLASYKASFGVPMPVNDTLAMMASLFTYHHDKHSYKADEAHYKMHYRPYKQLGTYDR